ncbi:Peptidyl-prolyl cis-trans isomerase [Salix suchowensis]|nr:Peptidyl-prolyl cis-trans isomerase [Salix suchowensis]
MGRKQTDPELGRYGLLVLFVMFLVSKVSDGLKSEDADGDCCRGIEHLELWGSEFNVNSSKACCLACKGMFSGGSGPCLCDSWLLPGCAPYSISYILDLLISHHCLGFHFYRAESRESLGIQKKWQLKKLHEIPTEACPPIRIGSVAGVESGPEFFISQANHDEWNKALKVFGFVLPEDMGIVERIAQLPTKPEVWGNANAAVLENPVWLHVRRINRSAGNQNLNTTETAAQVGLRF